MQQSQPPQLQADLPPQPVHDGVHEMDQVERKEDETKTENERMTKQKLKLKIERKQAEAGVVPSSSLVKLS